MGDWPLLVTVPGDPVGKGRPRARAIPVGGGKWSATIYTPKETRDWERSAAEAISAAYDGEPLDEPLMILVRAVKRRPKSRCRRRDPSGRIWRTTRPDGDNVLKAVQDAAVQAGLVVDDTRFVVSTVESYYAAKGEGPCVEVEVTPAGPYREQAQVETGF